MFSWIPMYSELANKLMLYRNRQSELIHIMDEIHALGVSAIKIEDYDKNGNVMPATEIDPFSFFANFSRGIKEANRIAILEFLKKRFELSSPLPSDFHGIPVANKQNAWFFAYSDKRKPNDISSLWDLAAACVAMAPDKLPPATFDRCLAIHQVGVSKLTMGLFWFNPKEYLALDSFMVNYLVEKSIAVKLQKIAVLADYLGVVADVKSKLGDNFPQLSRDAYVFSNQISISADDLDKGLATFLHQFAEKNNISVDDLVSYLREEEDSEENEITNRINALSEIQSILLAKPLDLTKLKKTLPKLWIFVSQSDGSRQSTFFNSDHAAQLIEDLLNDDTQDHTDQIDRFITDAIAVGYTDRNQSDSSGAVQFASGLLSARWPERYVDYRGSRWNNLYALITKSDKKLCTGFSHALKINRAGQFASALAKTPTFARYFGSEHGLWKVAGLAWYFRDGELKIEGNVVNRKHYWAGLNEWKIEQNTNNTIWQVIPYDNKNEALNKITWDTLANIKVGDEFAIKEVGARPDIKILFIGEVISIDHDKRSLELKKLTRSLYEGKLPVGENVEYWRHPLLQIHQPATIDLIFHNKKTTVPEVKMHELNQILYGPPGTGKTYSTIRKAVEIVDGKADENEAVVKSRFDQLTNQSRIGFVTFHQTFSYEDFVEGIRPVLDDAQPSSTPRYECRDGIFKKMCLAARAKSVIGGASSELDLKKLPRFWKMSLGNTRDANDTEIYEHCIRHNQIAHGYGRGKDFSKSATKEAVAEQLREEHWGPEESPSYHITAVDMLKNLMQKGDLVIITDGNHKFRAIGRVSGAYAFRAEEEYPQTRSVEWLRVFEESQPKERILRDRAFSMQTIYGISSAAINLDSLQSLLAIQPDAAPGNYVLIIDEINRGNISKIFGELITLLEEDKREGAKHALTTTLPYSQKPFSVPGNLFILGTMNTADKSIALVDVALRRRFRFEELMPKYELVPKFCRHLLKELNRRIVLRKDRDHQIGHSYLMGVADETAFDRIFKDNIIPLLQEYFFNDWEGLRFVLGEDKSTGTAGYIRKMETNGLNNIRNLWQWYSDANDLGLSPFAQSSNNYNITGD